MSFKEAAAELGVTPTAISHQIRLLEEICGQRLFQRHPRPIALTSAGERLFPVLRNGFDAFVSAVGSISTPTEAKPLKVTSPNAFASRWLVPRLPAWREARPDIPLEVIGTDAVLDLRSGEADVAIRYARRIPLDFAAEEICRDSFGPICSPDLLERYPHPIKSAADLLHFPFIHFDWLGWDLGAPTWQLWLAAARSVDRDLPESDAINGACDLNFREELHAIDAVVAGQGIAILSDVLVSHELKCRRLVKAHAFSLPGYGFYLVHLRNHPREPPIRALSAWVRSAL